MQDPIVTRGRIGWDRANNGLALYGAYSRIDVPLVSHLEEHGAASGTKFLIIAFPSARNEEQDDRVDAALKVIEAAAEAAIAQIEFVLGGRIS